MFVSATAARLLAGVAARVSTTGLLAGITATARLLTGITTTTRLLTGVTTTWLLSTWVLLVLHDDASFRLDKNTAREGPIYKLLRMSN